MAVVIGGNVFVDGVYVGNTSESIHPIGDGVVIEVDYEKPIIYVLGGN